MKNLLYLFLICFVLPNVIKAQSSNPCGKDWSEWRTAWNLPNGEVEFRLEFPTKKCGCGTNYVELKHSLPYSVKITVRLEGYDCDGKKYGERFFSDAIVGGEISKKGSIYHWFGSMPSAVVVILEYEEGGKKIKLEKNYAGTKTYINGMSEAAYNRKNLLPVVLLQLLSLLAEPQIIPQPIRHDPIHRPIRPVQILLLPHLLPVNSRHNRLSNNVCNARRLYGNNKKLNVVNGRKLFDKMNCAIRLNCRRSIGRVKQGLSGTRPSWMALPEFFPLFRITRRSGVCGKMLVNGQVS